ncbi:polar amino acid transport system permease protein [Saccharomonospora amisosensis]|uniref:Polar amino acid transport system permease protein n=1 Tax=Saccharomonospora amisosensis TaxID=1128677 RepID=A0A7X5UMR9_9PSEU|nr:ectoine/hydroxyectoine ABC transporter permease subunit EhuC [Saccharomonospora amisosensis]NIJ10893.1 polar amino acid transport system permease protein [Saccharomonospora amisosensis]
MFDNLGLVFSSVLQGLPITVSATIGGILLTIVLSFAAGLALLSKSRTVRFISRVYVEGFRGTSEVVQLFWIFFVLPLLVGIQLVPLFAGILVLGLNHGAYGAEIVRGAVQSVPKEQHEGAIALNLSPLQRMARVILPQAVVETLPSFNNLFIQLLKSTALLYFISAGEMTERGELLRPALPYNELLGIYGVELLFYLLLAIAITFGMRALERAGARKLGRRPKRKQTALSAAELGGAS